MGWSYQSFEIQVWGFKVGVFCDEKDKATWHVHLLFEPIKFSLSFGRLLKLPCMQPCRLYVVLLFVEIANQSIPPPISGVVFVMASSFTNHQHCDRAIMDYVPAASDNHSSVLSSSLCTIVRLRNRATSEAAFSLYCWRDAPLFTALIFFRGDDGMAVWCSHKKAVNLPCVYRVRVAFDDVAPPLNGMNVRCE